MTGAAAMVSVVIPCYNYAAYLPDAVNSVVNQTYREFEIIIVNDGSSDNSLEVAARLAAGSPDCRIRVIDQKNQGVAASRNNGIGLASGRYVMSLDADDWLEPTYLEETVSVLEEGADIAYTSLRMFGESSDIFLSWEFSPARLRRGNYINTHALYRRECWARAGGFSPPLRGLGVLGFPRGGGLCAQAYKEAARELPDARGVQEPRAGGRKG